MRLMACISVADGKDLGFALSRAAWGGVWLEECESEVGSRGASGPAVRRDGQAEVEAGGER